jgi:hypothetical protein
LRIHFLLNGRPQPLTQSARLSNQSVNSDDSDDSDNDSSWAKSCIAGLSGASHEAHDFNFEDDEESIEDDNDALKLVNQVVLEELRYEEDNDIILEDTSGKSKDNQYMFCPASHRLPLFRLIAKHHSLHSLLPERHATSRTAEEIHKDCVMEMYTHCTRNNLYEVWAYMWTSWYTPSKWTLWSRSAYPMAIPRKRTTMIVEALWRNLKHITLHQNNRPRLDFVLHLIFTSSIPTWRVKFAEAFKKLRVSRSHTLTTEQKSLKQAWGRLRTKPIKGNYETDIHQWTCSCGAQKYNAHLLCKHLVQAAPWPPASWWPEAFRCHTAPFYRVPGTSSHQLAIPELQPYHWLPRMPGYLPSAKPTLPKTPMRNPLGSLNNVSKKVSM